MPGSIVASAAPSSAAEFLGVPFWGWQVLFAAVGVLVLVLLARTAWHPTTRSLRWWALGNVVVNGGIAVTGSTVRVTGSGLGCSEWPRCTPDSFVPSGGEYHPVLNEAIEFGNRTLTFLVLAVGVIVVVAVWRMRHTRWRPDLLALAAVLPVGVLAQAVVGGITVWSGLHPAAVNTHFLLSMLVVIAAMAFYVRCREPRGPLRLTAAPAARRISAVLVVLGFALLTLGAVTSGTGPHGGDIDAPRWDLDFVLVTRLHAAAAWAAVAGAVILAVVLLRRPAPRPLRMQTALLLAVLLAQGVLGYIQYALALPEWLVVLHVLGSVLSWTAILRVYFGTAERGTGVTAAAATTPARAPAPEEADRR